MRAHERFFNYIQFDTASDENSPSCPSTEKQLVLARALAEEMREMGIADARVDEHGYVYGSIPANRENQGAIGLIAHMDVVDAAPSLPMNARIVKNYDGGKVTLDSGDVLDPAAFPALSSKAGMDLIVTDGRTILGADDKAGIAEILTMCERLLMDASIPHGKIAIGFTPDEEIGRGANLFDVAGFGADYAYTVDGGEVGGVDFETFNAATGLITVNGVSIHTGGAKNRMKNASLIAMEFNSLIPPAELPQHTEGYEGFYHLDSISGEVEKAEMKYILRDHDRARFEARKAHFARAAAFLNAKYGENTVVCKLIDSYSNMREVIEPRMEIVERAYAAWRAVGVEPYSTPVRGGTDGCRLSFMGLPCPNLSTGGMNAHGRLECVAVQDMDKIVDMLVELVRAR